ncbi:mitogen-activated protein kinase kinase kinase 19 [Pelobates fuscus]|uniref:mitogen-activated protein kinase kinase kinase 19 n=1 Tax=Pelobates fuscus TaxID=191477 RepID=UPI002FE476A5
MMLKMTEGSLTEFLEASANGDLERLRLIASHAEPGYINYQRPQSGDTALILAAEGNFSEVVSFLLEHGADVTLCNVSNQTAAHVAKEEIQRQLLSALLRTSFPHLRLTQAAWQGDLEAVQYLLSAEPVMDVNMPNQQGLTPLMLAVRDEDLFDKLNVVYRPLDILAELLKHNADPRICDFNGKSALCYASGVKSPRRQQLIDALEVGLSKPDAEDQAFCGFCPDTKHPLLDNPTSNREQISLAAQLGGPGSELNEDENYIRAEKEDIGNMKSNSRNNNKTDFRIMSDLQRGAQAAQDMEKLYKECEMQKTLLSRYWLTEPLPKAAVSKGNNKLDTLYPPSCRKTDDISEKMKGLGLGYLLQGSRSEPNILQTLGTNPLTDILDIKQNIFQRLTSPDTERTRTMRGPSSLCQSPRCVRLSPLQKSRAKTMDEIKVTNAVPTFLRSSESFLESPALELSSSHGDSHKSAQARNPDDMSKELIYISIGESMIISESLEHNNSGRSCQMSLSVDEKFNQSLISEGYFMDTIAGPGESTEKVLANEDEIICKEIVLEEQMVDSGHLPIYKENRADEIFDNYKTKLDSQPIDGKGVLKETTEPDFLRTPRQDLVGFVHITFSEPESPKEQRSSSAKQSQKKRRWNRSSVPHNVNHSFNIIAQKENERTKKNKKIRNKSASDVFLKNQQRPLSNHKKTSLKNISVSSMEFMATSPTNSKNFRKAHHLENINLDKNSKRSYTHLALYTPIKVSKPCVARANTAPDFQNIKYPDMFVQMNPQNEGPGIYQMFETSFYSSGKELSTEDSNLCRESTSSTRSLVSKSVRSLSANDSKTKIQKKAQSRNKKSSSALTQKRKSSLTKEKAVTDVLNKIEDNVVIISGTDWHIEAIKHNDFNTNNDVIPTENGRQNKYSDLSIIKEATIEGSLSINGSSHAQFAQMVIEISKGFDEKIAQHEHSKPKEVPKDESGQQGIVLSSGSLTKYNKDGQNDQILRTKDLPQNDEDLIDINDEKPTDLIRQVYTEVREENAFNKLKNASHNIHMENTLKDNLMENEGDPEHTIMVSETDDEDISTDTESEQTDELLSQLAQKMISLDEKESSLYRTLTNAQVAFETLRSHSQNADLEEEISSVKEGNKKESLNSNTNNLNPTEDIGEYSQHVDGITWIKGEVLGKGAYGTVYCGLTSQGELIAAKQVVLDASDHVTAEKEYKKLQEEVELLKVLKHANIVGYLGTCLQDNIVTIFMEFVPGGSISSILKRFGPLHEIVISRYTKHILQGIAYLHNNRVIHRDIKGNNVMLMPNGVLKLIDFGCAKRLTRLSMSGTRSEVLISMHGTPFWMAPEVINESGHGEKSDIWSIGCTVFEMATGKPPLAHMHKMAAMYYIGANKGLMPTLPDHFSKRARDFVDLCLTRDQGERPSAEKLLQHSFIKRR